MKVEQIYTGCLAEAAYYIESKGEVMIIDPLRETAPYLERAEKAGAKIKYIFETHFHADFVSGHVDLAKKTGASIIYGPTAKPGYKAHIAKDGEVFKLGDITLTLLHTPGHTLESSCMLLKDEEGKEYALFSGDTLFIGDVGRPDLAIKQGELTKADLAGFLFDSLRNKVMTLPDDVIIYPNHGAGSACGKNMSSETFDSLGNQKKVNYALRANMTKAEFVTEVTAGLTAPPQYFGKNAMLNMKGYGSFDDVLRSGNIALSPQRFEDLVENQEALMLDTRDSKDFAKEHIPNSIFIGIDGSFAPWIGALITDIKQPIVVIAPQGREEEVITRLARVGYDNTLGYLTGGIETWKKAGKETAKVVSVTAKKIAERIEKEQQGIILDVRKPTEFLTQHVQGVMNFPLDYLNNNMNKLDRKETYHLYCRSGFRSMIAASILKSRGFNNIVDIKKGWTAIEESDVPKTAHVCPTTMTQEVIDAAVEAVV